MAVRARPGIRTARLVGGLAVAGALLVAAPATALAQEATPAPTPTAAPAEAIPPPPVAAPRTRAAESAPPAVRSARPAPPGVALPGQVSRVPQGAPETGGGATAPGTDAAPFVLGGVALLGAAGAVTAVTARRRRSSSQG